MGNRIITSDEFFTTQLSKDKFIFMQIIGKGTFGDIWEAQLPDSNHKCAIKLIRKNLITSKSASKVIENEKEILSKINHNFIANLLLAFQDPSNIYFVIELKEGGDLRYHMSMNIKFTEKQCKFFAGCLLIALEYIHTKEIIHRDIKPENILFDEEGYLFLTDFGVSGFLKNGICYETTGTPGYMAPEILLKQPHGKVSDFFSLGVILFEAMIGSRPFKKMNKDYILKKVCKSEISLDETFYQENLSGDCEDFVKSLLVKKPQERLGFNGINEIFEHPWLSSVNWQMIRRKYALPPFKPKLFENFSDFAQNEKNLNRKLNKEVDYSTTSKGRASI